MSLDEAIERVHVAVNELRTDVRGVKGSIGEFGVELGTLKSGLQARAWDQTKQVDINGSMGTRVLLVDDDPLVLRSGIRMLSLAGMTVFLADSADAARAIMGVNPVDCVLLDVWMPRENGLELARDIRRRWPTRPIAFITSKIDESVEATAAEVGAFGLYQKPFIEAKDLVGAIKAACGGTEG